MNGENSGTANQISRVAVHNLKFTYRKHGDELYGGLTHSFAPSGLTAITGESGRGKSTLLYIIGLLLRPTCGDVTIGTSTLSALSDRQASAVRARRIGFVFQDSELDHSRPILDSIIEPGLYAGVPYRQLRERGVALLTQFGLQKRVNHRPGQISGGQAQRVAVCRALINDPELILADEPTGNLDPRNSETVIRSLRQAAEQGRTVIVATHDPTVISQADEVVQL